MEVYVAGSRSGAQDWLRAQRVPAADLPQLSPAQRATAESMGLSAEDYARSVMAGDLGRFELQEKAGAFGELFQRLLKEVRPGAEVREVLLDTFHGSLQVKVFFESRIFSLRVDEERVDDLLLTGSAHLERRLRRILDLNIPLTSQSSPR